MKIFVKIEPLAEDVVEMIRTGKINDNMDKKELAKVLREKGWDADEARKIISIESGNMFVDATKGVQYLQESLDSIKSGFIDIMISGPMAQEHCRGIKIILHHYVPHEDPAHRTLAQLLPATRRAAMGAILTASPILLEPVLGIEVKCPADMIGTVAGILSGKRGKLINVDQKGVIAIILGEVPASETFDLAETMLGGTAGKAVWNTHFKLWQAVPSSLLMPIITEVRKRKGLSPEPPRPDEFIDRE